ncbi:hypothetical protein [Microbacterium sp. P04]|uniref:hypothetical protein n=1 Tax=Microbacterium sp. P04 TaxID=3366947 RepID=UPI0037467117
MSIPSDSTPADDTTVDDPELEATQDDTTFDDPSMNDDTIRPVGDVETDSIPDTFEDMPAQDAQALDLDDPITQGESPIEAELGEDGQGDLAPEDLGGDGSDGPTDLRTSL